MKSLIKQWSVEDVARIIKSCETCSKSYLEFAEDIIDFYNVRYQVYQDFTKDLKEYGYSRFILFENTVVVHKYERKLPTELLIPGHFVLNGERVVSSESDYYYRIYINLENGSTYYVALPYDESEKNLVLNLDPDCWKNAIRRLLKISLESNIKQKMTELKELEKVYGRFFDQDLE